MLPSNLEERFIRFHENKLNELLFELSCIIVKPTEFTYNNPVGSVTFKIR